MNNLWHLKRSPLLLQGSTWTQRVPAYSNFISSLQRFPLSMTLLRQSIHFRCTHFGRKQCTCRNIPGSHRWVRREDWARELPRLCLHRQELTWYISTPDCNFPAQWLRQREPFSSDISKTEIPGWWNTVMSKEEKDPRLQFQPDQGPNWKFTCAQVHLSFWFFCLEFNRSQEKNSNRLTRGCLKCIVCCVTSSSWIARLRGLFLKRKKFCAE